MEDKRQEKDVRQKNIERKAEAFQEAERIIGRERINQNLMKERGKKLKTVKKGERNKKKEDRGHKQEQKKNVENRKE